MQFHSHGKLLTTLMLLTLHSMSGATTVTLTTKQEALLVSTVDKIAKGRYEIAPDFMSPDAAAISEALVLEAHKTPEIKLRKDLLAHAARIETNAFQRNRDKAKTRPHNMLFLEEMTQMFEWTPSIRFVIPISLLFSPQEVDKYAMTIRAGILRAKAEGNMNSGDILLFGYLPSTTSEQARELIEGFKPSSKLDSLAVDALLAQYGDKAALDRLVTAANTYGSELPSNRVHEFTFGDCLASVPTKEMKEFLAKGLRSDEVFEFGENTRVKRFIYARALARMLKDDPSFKVTFGWRDYRDKELDEMEKWCTEHLGVEYPKTSRKPLYSGSEMIPVREDKPVPTPERK